MVEKMTIYKLIILLTVSIQLCFAKDSSSIKAPEHNIIECKIIDMNGKIIKDFGTSRCIFLPDGSVVAGSYNKLVFYNPNMMKKWEKKINTHHQLNLSVDSKHILVMSSTVHKIKNINLRFDRFIVYDFTGNIIKQSDFFDHQKELLSKTTPDKRQPWRIGESLKKHAPEAELEFSHANSFYEIDENSLGEKHAIFKKGNYIININLLGIVVIMDSDLKTILWSMPQYTQKDLRPSWHDVYVLKSGSLLVFNNNSFVLNKRPGTTIDEVNPITKEKKILYQETSPVSFYSEFSGGIQILPNNNFLINTVSPYGKAFEIDAKTKKVVWSMDNPVIDSSTGKPEIYQQIRRMDLSSFLEKNQGL
jgi:hypothetical protein